MSTAQATTTATAPTVNAPMYEYLQVQATVSNFTDQSMILTGSNLSWGKWMQTPVDVPAQDASNFSSQGRDSSPSGTEGWATWSIGKATITVMFSSPFVGSNTQSITCVPAGAYSVSCNGTGGHVNTCGFKIRRAS